MALLVCPALPGVGPAVPGVCEILRKLSSCQVCLCVEVQGLFGSLFLTQHLILLQWALGTLQTLWEKCWGITCPSQWPATFNTELG